MEPNQDNFDPHKVAEETLAFLRSPEGQEAAREAARRTQRFADELKLMRTRYPEVMHRRFTI